MADKFSLWVMPDKPTIEILTPIMSEYSEKFGVPNVEPHLTILPAIESKQYEFINKAQQISALSAPFMMESGDVEISTTYFQCVLLRIKTSAELVNLNLVAQQAFDIDPLMVFMPHISLVYGNMDAFDRYKIAQQIKLPPLKFLVDKLVVVPSTPDPAEWVHLAEFDLKKN